MKDITRELEDETQYSPIVPQFIPEEDLLLIQLLYEGISYSSISQTLKKPLRTILYRIERLSKSKGCLTHKQYIHGCVKCYISGVKAREKSIYSHFNLLYKENTLIPIIIPNEAKAKEEKRRFTLEEDYFIIHNGFDNLSFVQLGKILNRKENAIRTHIRVLYQPPHCFIHEQYFRWCRSCNNLIKLWRERVLKGIKQKIKAIHNQTRKHTHVTVSVPFSKEENIYVIEHVFDGASFDELSKEINKRPNQIFKHLLQKFGIPHCPNHQYFNESCKECSEIKENWKKINRDNINKEDKNKSRKSLPVKGYKKVRSLF